MPKQNLNNVKGMFKTNGESREYSPKKDFFLSDAEVEKFDMKAYFDRLKATILATPPKSVFKHFAHFIDFNGEKLTWNTDKINTLNEYTSLYSTYIICVNSQGKRTDKLIV